MNFGNFLICKYLLLKKNKLGKNLRNFCNLNLKIYVNYVCVYFFLLIFETQGSVDSWTKKQSEQLLANQFGGFV